MKIIPAVIAAAVASAVGAVVWVLIRNFTGYELGLVAWGIGVLAGVGAAAATAGNSDGATGFVAGCVAVLAIAGRNTPSPRWSTAMSCRSSMTRA